MTDFKLVQFRQMVMGKLAHGCDLLEELTRIAVEHDVRLGRITAIGAVRKAQLGYYNQETRAYQFHTFDTPLEITSLVGNISLKDGKPFVHAHVTLSDETGACFGGHLAPGTTVFACEFILEAFDGPDFNRSFDPVTGLPLWE